MFVGIRVGWHCWKLAARSRPLRRDEIQHLQEKVKKRWGLNVHILPDVVVLGWWWGWCWHREALQKYQVSSFSVICPEALVQLNTCKAWWPLFVPNPRDIRPRTLRIHQQPEINYCWANNLLSRDSEHLCYVKRFNNLKDNVIRLSVWLLNYWEHTSFAWLRYSPSNRASMQHLITN